MGKLKEESDDEMAMDIEKPVKDRIVKKKKLIAKQRRTENKQQMIGQKKSQSSNKGLIQKLAKKINLKKKQKDLTQKQQIFSKVVKSLQEKSHVPRKERKKQRVLLKKEMRKLLEQDRIQKRRKSIEMGEGEPNNRNDKSIRGLQTKKREVDQRKQVAQYHSLMGMGLQGIRNLIVKNISNKSTNKK